MALVMTATPLSMHINDGHSVEQTANVIRAHVLGMYVPSLVSGFLIERLGVVRMMFVGALGLLTYTYSMAERFRAQAVNEFLVFGTAASASLLAGMVMHYFGWFWLMWIPIPILLIVCIALVAARKDQLLRRVTTPIPDAQ